MLSPRLFLLLVGLLVIAEAQQFVSPKYQPTKIPGPYGGDSLWSLGSSQLVAFQTDWTEYTIEFWQQGIGGGYPIKAAKPVYTHNVGDNAPQSFFWTVQTYELQLSDSNAFFFWLRDGKSDAQRSSAYFNIIIGAPPLSSSSTSSSSTSSSVATSTQRPTATTAGMKPTTSSTDNIPVSSFLPPVSTPVPSLAAATTGVGASGLSAGATAGIGVGVSFGVLLVAAIAGFAWYRRRRRGGRPMGAAEMLADLSRPDAPKTTTTLPWGENNGPDYGYKYVTTAAGELPTSYNDRRHLPELAS